MTYTNILYHIIPHVLVEELISECAGTCGSPPLWVLLLLLPATLSNVWRRNILTFSFETVWNSISSLDDHSAVDTQYTVIETSNKANTKWHLGVSSTALRNGFCRRFIYVLSHLREDRRREMETSQILYNRSTQMFVGVSIYRYIDILHLSGAYNISLLLRGLEL